MITFLLPVGLCLLAIYVASRWSLSKAALWVYLPILMWLPLYFAYGVGGTFINPASLVGAFLAFMVLKKGYHSWNFSVMDLLVFLYAFSMFCSDLQRHTLKVASYAMATLTLECTIPYILGKALVESAKLRAQFAKMLVLCLAAMAIVSVYEFRMTYNLFQTAVELITHHHSEWARQRRWGFARIAGPYGHAITAGMVFTTGVMLQFWLVASKRWEAARELASKPGINFSKRIKWITFLVILGLFMTQSRGPWMGCAIGLIVAGISLSRNRKRSAVIAGLLLAVSLTTFYGIINQYTDASNAQSASVDQQNAIYRRELLTTYTPLVEEGGMWGWGNPAPTSSGVGAYNLNQPSIDNEFLRVTVAQGYFGFTVFILLILTSIGILIRHLVILRNREDIIFAFALLGVIVATSFSLSTVYLGQPMQELLFFVFGWACSLQPTLRESDTVTLAPKPKFEFEKVFA